jgi:taurine dioxygenase
VSNQNGQGLLNIGPYWHSDGAYLTDPTAVSIHHIIAPTEDGDTLYADLAAAYERLSEQDKARVAASRTRNETGVLHPLVRRHPVTGRLGLYVNMGAGSTVIDQSGHEDKALRDAICEHLSRDGAFYRHKWRLGDLIVVDNFAVAHHATPANPSALRILHRTSIHGPAVWWRTASADGTPEPTSTSKQLPKATHPVAYAQMQTSGR